MTYSLFLKFLPNYIYVLISSDFFTKSPFVGVSIRITVMFSRIVFFSLRGAQERTPYGT